MFNSISRSGLHRVVWIICIAHLLGNLTLSAAKAGKSYYLDFNSKAVDNLGTIKSPWKTVESLHNHKFSPGDSVLFARGSTFRGGFAITSSGTAKQPIVFTAYGLGRTPIFSNPRYDSLNDNVMQVNASYIIIDGLYFENSPRSPVVESIKTLGAIFISLGADHNIVRNCEMSKTPVGIQVYGQHTLITKNYIHDNNVPIRPYWGPMCLMVNTSNNEVSYNRFENYVASSNGFGHDGGAIEINDGDYDKINLNIHHNYSWDNQGFLENIQSDCVSKNWYIAYNVSNDWQSWLGLTNVQEIYVEHNTVLRIRRHEGYNDFFWFNEDRGDNNVQFRNNIFVVGGGVPPIYYHGDGKLQHHDHNLYYALDRTTYEDGGNFSVLGTPLGDGEKIANPLFVDMEAGNLRLTAGSPAINAGVDLGHKQDFDGNKVPYGPAPDMGAFEYRP